MCDESDGDLQEMKTATTLNLFINMIGFLDYTKLVKLYFLLRKSELTTGQGEPGGRRSGSRVGGPACGGQRALEEKSENLGRSNTLTP